MQCGADPCTPTKDGTCPIHTAVVLESPSGPAIVSKMLSYGADTNIKTPTGLSPLHIAAMWGRVETINVLLDHGADIAHKDNDDMSALDYAEEAEENKYACIDALTCFRPGINQRNNCFLTKSRFNLHKIVGGNVLLSSFSSGSGSSTKVKTVDKPAEHVSLKSGSFIHDRGKSKENIPDYSKAIQNKSLENKLFSLEDNFDDSVF